MLVLGGIACGAVYAVVSPPRPIIKPSTATAPSRTLAYEQQITRPGAAEPASEQGTHTMAPANSTQAQPATPQTAANAEAAPTVNQGEPAATQAPSQAGSSPQTAALSPEEGADKAGAEDPGALPWQHRAARPGYPATQGESSSESDPMAAQPGEDGYEDGYDADSMAARPEDADPNAWPGGPQDEPQEWVQVLVSGAGMHAAASDEAPALFAFPYGRPLRVVSRYSGWVEVTDPQSAATGWMKAEYLAPMAAPRPPGEAEAWYDDERPRRRGWFRRHGGGFADMIDRAFGGHW